MKSNKIAVGGMIASGKSTLTKALAEKLEYKCLAEFREDDDVFNQMLKWLYEGKNIELQLQTYFIEKHYKHAKKHEHKNLVVDRDIIEHWLFAQTNLKDKDPKLMMFYNNLFHAFYLEHKRPDLYIILDISFEEFKNRIFKRGRKVEIDNWEKNKDYFEKLLSNYVDKLVAQCEIYDVNYKIIKVDEMDKEEVLNVAFDLVLDKVGSKEQIVLEVKGMEEYE